MCSYVARSACLWVCLCVCRSEVDIRHLLPLLFILSFETGSLTEPKARLNNQWALGLCLPLTFPKARVTDVHDIPSFYVVAGDHDSNLHHWKWILLQLSLLLSPECCIFDISISLSSCLTSSLVLKAPKVWIPSEYFSLFLFK